MEQKWAMYVGHTISSLNDSGVNPGTLKAPITIATPISEVLTGNQYKC